MDNGVKYTAEILTNDASEIRKNTTDFDSQMQDLLDTSRAMGNNYQSEDATAILEAIKTVSEETDGLKEAIEAFATAIESEIVPAYQAMEAKARTTVESFYV